MLHTSLRREESRVYQQQQPRWLKRVLWLGGILVTLLVVLFRWLPPARLLLKRVLWLGGILVTLLVVLFLIRIGYAASWTGFTGFGPHKLKEHIQPAKTLWDWLDLLIVPIVLAIGGFLFTRSETRATQAAAERRAQEGALQAYLDHMSAMLLPNKDQPSLYRAHPGDSLSSVARARTLTVLPRLDGDRKARVVQFLHESGLIAKKRPNVAMIGADLRVAYLLGVNLRGAALTSANLIGADLRVAYLLGVNLKDANLSGANLSEANLSGARGWTDEQLSAANSLEGSTMPDGQTLRGNKMPNGPTFEDWLKGQEGKNTGP
jgi:hypothetical protein